MDEFSALGPAVDVLEKGTTDTLTSTRPLTSIDSEGNEVVLGDLRFRDYESNRDVRGLQLTCANGKSHRLGAATKQFRVINHSEVVAPLLDAGFVPERIFHMRGGASFNGLFSYPGHVWADPIIWDMERYDTRTDPEKVIKLAALVRSDIRVGHGFHITAGYFRTICVNGLVVKVLDMGMIHFTHVNFDPIALKDWMTDLLDDIPEPMLPHTPVKALEYPISLIAHQGSIMTMENKEDSAQAMAEFHGGLSKFARKPLQIMARSLGAVTHGLLVSELSTLSEKVERFGTLDILNAVTNLPNATNRIGVLHRIYNRLEPISGALADLVEVGLIKAA